MTTAKRSCSWDNEPHPTLNLWTTDGIDSALPGVAHPLSADLLGLSMQRVARQLVERAGVGDRVHLAEPPAANLFGVFAGRWSLNHAWLAAYLDALASENEQNSARQGSAADGFAATSGRSTGRTPAAPVLQPPWQAQSPAVALREREVAAGWQREMAARDLVPISDSELLGWIEQTVALCADLLLTLCDALLARDASLAALTEFLTAKANEYGARLHQAAAPVRPAAGSQSPALGTRAPAAASRRAARERRVLEDELRPTLSKEERSILDSIQRDARMYARARVQAAANLRHACRAFRPPLLELGGRMQRLGLIAAREDLWYLRWTEALAATRDELPADEAQRAVAQRRAEYQRLQAAE